MRSLCSRNNLSSRPHPLLRCAVVVVGLRFFTDLPGDHSIPQFHLNKLLSRNDIDESSPTDPQLKKRLSKPLELAMRHFRLYDPDISNNWISAITAFLKTRTVLEGVWRPLPGDYVYALRILRGHNTAIRALYNAMQIDFTRDQQHVPGGGRGNVRAEEQCLSNTRNTFPFLLEDGVGGDSERRPASAAGSGSATSSAGSSALKPNDARWDTLRFLSQMRGIDASRWQEALRLRSDFGERVRQMRPDELSQYERSEKVQKCVQRIDGAIATLLCRSHSVAAVAQLVQCGSLSFHGSISRVAEFSWAEALHCAARFRSAQPAERMQRLLAIGVVHTLMANGLYRVEGAWRVALRHIADCGDRQGIKAILAAQPPPPSPRYMAFTYFSALHHDLAFRAGQNETLFESGHLLNRAAETPRENWRTIIPALPKVTILRRVFAGLIKTMRTFPHPMGGRLLSEHPRVVCDRALARNEGVAIVDTSALDFLLISSPDELQQQLREAAAEAVGPAAGSAQSCLPTHYRLIVPWVTLFEGRRARKSEAVASFSMRLRNLFEGKGHLISYSCDIDFFSTVLAPITRLYSNSLSVPDRNVATMALLHDYLFRMAETSGSHPRSDHTTGPVSAKTTPPITEVFANSDEGSLQPDDAGDETADVDASDATMTLNEYTHTHVDRALHRARGGPLPASLMPTGRVILMTRDVELATTMLNASIVAFPMSSKIHSHSEAASVGEEDEEGPQGSREDMTDVMDDGVDDAFGDRDEPDGE